MRNLTLLDIVHKAIDLDIFSKDDNVTDIVAHDPHTIFSAILFLAHKERFNAPNKTIEMVKAINNYLNDTP